MVDMRSSSVERTVSATATGPPLGYLDSGIPATSTVLLLHSLGADGRMWRAQWDGLVSGSRVLAMDSRGHGRSGWDGTATVEAWVDDVDRVLAHAAVDRVTVIGVSMGGIQAMAYAARHPARVTGLVIADSFARLGPEMADGRIGALTAQARRLGMAGFADAYVADTFTAPVPRGARDVRDSIACLDPFAYSASVRACFSADIADLLPLITAPTLVLWGDRDQKTPRRLSEDIAVAVTDARLREVPNAGHLSNVDNPVAFTSLVSGFLGTLACHGRTGVT